MFVNCLYCGKQYNKCGDSYTTHINKLKFKDNCCCCWECANNLSKQRLKETLKKKLLENPNYLSDRSRKTHKTMKSNGTYIYSDSFISPFTKESVRKKSKETIIGKYGVDNAMKVPEFKQKLKDKFIEKYGVDNPMKDTNILDKMRRTNLEKYGYACSLQNNRNNIKQTWLNKYGVDNPAKAQKIKEKMSKTCKERYGVDWYMGSEDFFKKQKEFLMQNYGVEFPTQSTIIKEKVIKTNLERYGKEHYTQTEEFLDKLRMTCNERYGVDYNCLSDNCLRGQKNGGRFSKINQRWMSLFEERGLKVSPEFTLGKYVYDFILKESNTLIEINPTYTHQSLYPVYNMKTTLSESYHLKKTEHAKIEGYKCLHVWDWDNEDKIINLLTPVKYKISLRKCSVKRITSTQASDFLDKYHIQGKCRGILYAYGLFYSDILISVSTFGKSRYDKNFEYEWLRHATNNEYLIHGGSASKLLDLFINDNKPTSIVSYCDKSKFDGKMFEYLGFKHDLDSSPSCRWYNGKLNKVIYQTELNKLGACKLLNIPQIDRKETGISNIDILINNKFLPIYDCGQSKHIWRSL